MTRWDTLYVDGVFDLVHSGHFNGIRQAKQFAHTVVVGVNADEEAHAAKGAAPILQCDERAVILEACRWVSRTIPNAPYETSLWYLKEVARCDAVAHGDDLVVGVDGTDCYAEPRKVGLFQVFRRSTGISSTSILCRLLLCKLVSRHLYCVTGAIANGLLTEDQVGKIHDSDAITGPISGPFDTRRLLEFIGYPRIIKARLRAKSLTQKEARHNMIIVYVSGMFDILRADQIHMLTEAAKLGTHLIVGLYADSIIQKLLGHKESPILSLTERMMNLYALNCVDEVVMNAPFNPDVTFFHSYGITTVVVPKMSDSLLAKMPALECLQITDFHGLCSDSGINVVCLNSDSTNCIIPTLLKLESAFLNCSLANLFERQRKNERINLEGTGVEAVRVEF